jgi:hypothetical protein
MSSLVNAAIALSSVWPCAGPAVAAWAAAAASEVTTRLGSKVKRSKSGKGVEVRGVDAVVIPEVARTSPSDTSDSRDDVIETSGELATGASITAVPLSSNA